MPNLDGYEMAKAIRKYEKETIKPPIPIIAVTGVAMKGDADFCISVGMNDFISKPVKLNELQAKIEAWYYDKHNSHT